MSNIVSSLLDRWATFLARRRVAVIVIILLLAVASIPLAVNILRHLDADIFNQVSDQLPRFRVMRELTADFGGDVFVAAAWIPDESAKDPAKVKELCAFGDLMAAELAQVGTTDEDALSFSVSKVPQNSMAPQREPWLREVECRAGQNLRQAMSKLIQEHPHIALGVDDVERVKQVFEPEAMAARLKRLRAELAALDPAMSAERRRLMADPLGLAGLGEEALERRLRAQKKDMGLAGRDGYFLSPDGTMLVIVARPIRGAKDLTFNKALMNAAQRAENRAIAALQARTPAATLGTALKGATYGEYAGSGGPSELRVGFTGMHAVAVENEASLRYDVIINALTAGLFVMAIYVLAYWRVRLAFHVILTLALAVLFTLALTGPLHGPIGVLGAGFTSILIGMGEDYAVYLHNTFQSMRAEAGATMESALRKTLTSCGPSILAAAATAAAAFFSMGLTHFRGLAELGLLAGMGLTLSALLMLSFFLALTTGGHGGEGKTDVARWLRSLVSRWSEFQATTAGISSSLVIGAAVAVAAIALLIFTPAPQGDALLGVRFDGDFSNLRSLRIKAIPLRDQILERFKRGFADIRVVVEAPDEGSAYRAAARVAANVQPLVEKGELSVGGTILDLAPSGAAQEETIKALQALDLNARSNAFLEAAKVEYGERAENAFRDFTARLNDWAAKARTARPLSIQDVRSGPLGLLVEPYARVDETDSRKVVRLASYYYPSGLTLPEEWYESLAARIEGAATDGVRVQVTAARMVGFELKNYLFKDLAWITGVVAIVVVIVMLTMYRSIWKAFLAGMPLVFGYLFLLSGVVVAQCAGWDFSLNYVNLMVFPLLLGTGIDYGIYMVSDAYSERKPGLVQLVSETGLSVFVACLTTLAGFGSMVFSNYTGLVSFGWAALLGYAGTLFGALLVLPALLEWRKHQSSP